MVILADKDFKAAMIIIFKEPKETMLKRNNERYDDDASSNRKHP